MRESGALQASGCAKASSMSSAKCFGPYLHDLTGQNILKNAKSATMRAPSTAALIVLAGLCYDAPFCLADAQQEPLKAKERYKAACPAYDHYARSPQYDHDSSCTLVVLADML